MSAFNIILTADQSAQIADSMLPNLTLIGRVMREQFDGTNATTCGRLVLEVGTVPTSTLPALREAIRKAKKPAAKRPRKGQG